MKLIATREEVFRFERLVLFLKYLHLHHPKVLPMLESLEDHKGMLYVVWNVRPVEEEELLMGDIWEDEFNEDCENVQHTCPQTSIESLRKET